MTNTQAYNHDTANSYCRTLLDILWAKGVKEFVLSPGSRNTPLLIGVSCRPFKRTVIIDERAAAFIALGKAIGTQRPVAIACTSGTALYNYAPAVAEAYYQSVPLIVISADRPLEWIDQDDSQTLRQPGALANIVKGSFDIPVERLDDTEMGWYVNRTVNEALNLATSGIPGPVHINIRLDNPLSRTIPFSPSQPRVIDFIEDKILSPQTYGALAKDLLGKKILVVAGFMPPNSELNNWLGRFNKLPQVKIFAETISNLHLHEDPYCIDTVISYLDPTKHDLHSLQPDVVISIGGALVSRKLKEFIRSNPPAQHWTLADTQTCADCFRSLTKHIEVSPTEFFKKMSKLLAKQSTEKAVGYKLAWTEIYNESRLAHRKLCLNNEKEFLELNIYHKLLNSIPSDWNLVLSNGTPIRYAQLFTDRIPHASYCNRGVSGIDGSTATAVGLSTTYQKPTLLITGDVSFAYDTDLLSARALAPNLKIIVINNQGGGIFRFIPTTRAIEQREELFCADPKTPIRQLAKANEWQYLHADTNETLAKALSTMWKSTHSTLLEICVDGEKSAQYLTEYLSLQP